MTYQEDSTLPYGLSEQITMQGFDLLPELIRVMINSTMQIERQKYLGAGLYERTSARKAHANGFKSKSVKTRVGEITFDVPQVHEGGFYPDALEKGLRSERALTLALPEMYVQGVSTRTVATIIKQLCGTSVATTQVSRAASLLDKTLEVWRNRPLGEFPYVYLYARYEKVRQEGQIRDATVLIACGVSSQEKRHILGVYIALDEQEDHRRDFLQSLVERGLNDVELIVSDALVELQAARKAVFSGIP